MLNLNSAIADIPIGLIISVVLAVITVLALGFGLLFGFKRNGMMTIVRFIFLALAIVLAALAATVFAVIVLDKNSEQILAAVSNLVNDDLIESLREYMASGAAAVEDVKKLIVAFAAPVIFSVVFLVADIVFLIIYAIVAACTCSNRHRRNAAQDRGEEVKKTSVGVRIAVVCSNVVMSFLIAICLILPVTYYANLAADVASNSDELMEAVRSQTTDGGASAQSEENDETEELISLLKEVKSNPLMQVYGTLSNAVAMPITTVYGQSLHDMVLSFIPAVTNVWEEVNKLDTESLSADTLDEETVDQIETIIRTASSELKNVKAIDNFIGNVVCDAASYWEKGDPFLTIDIYKLLGDKSGETSDGETFKLKPVVKVVCEVLADKEKPLASDKLSLAADIIGPAGGIMPVITAFSNVESVDDVKDLDVETLEKIYTVAKEYEENEYADGKFGQIICAVLESSSSLGLPEEYGDILQAVTDSLTDEEKQKASSMLNLVGDALIVTVEVVQEIDTQSTEIADLKESIDNAADILVKKERVDTILGGILIDSPDIIPISDDYGDVMDAAMDALNEKSDLYQKGSDILYLLSDTLEIMVKFTDIADGLSVDELNEIADDLASGNYDEVNRVLAVILDEAVEAWSDGETFCGISDPLGDYSDISSIVYGAITDESLESASDMIRFMGDIVSSVDDLTTIEFDNVSSQTFYDLAGKIVENYLVDETTGYLVDKTTGNILSEAATAWRDGKPFCGYDDPIGESSVASSLYNIFITTKDTSPLASDKYNAAGNAIDIASIVLGVSIGGSSQEGSETPTDTSTKAQVGTLVDNLSQNSADIVKNALTDKVISSIADSQAGTIVNTEDEKSSAAVSTAVSSLVDSLLEVKNSEDSEAAKKEQQAVADIFDAMNNTETMTEEDATNLVESVKNSTVVSNTVSSLIVTDEEGNKSSAINIDVDEDTKTSISNALDSVEDVDEDLKNNLLILFGIGIN